MAEDADTTTAAPPKKARPTPRARAARPKRPAAEPAASAEKEGSPAKAEEPSPPKASGTAKPAPKKAAEAPGPKAPRRPTLDPEALRDLALRRSQDIRRPRFTRQASYRYWRIGRDGSWRKPRGQQSKQRRHYGYRSTIASIGFGTPRGARGLTPTGFRPRLVRTPAEIEALDAARDTAIIARTVGTRLRLRLEETARRRGVHVANPILKEREES